MQDPTSGVQKQPTVVERHVASPDLPITELGLRSSAKDALLGAGISTVGDVLATLEKGDEALTDVSGFGPKSLAELKKRLREHGFLPLSIAELGLRARTRNALLGAGISTVADVLAILDKEDKALTNLKGFGPTSLVELKERLREHGFLLPGRVALPLEVAKTVKPRLGKSVEEEAALAAALLAEEEAALEEKAPGPEEVAVITVEAAPQAEPLSEVPTLGHRIQATFAQAREQFNLGAWAYSAIGVLIIAALLFLPPFSLLERLGVVGYTTVNTENNSTSHPDGLMLSVDPETFTGKLRVRLASVPRLEFLEGSAGAALRKAVEALPSHLIVKSPFYQIQVRGDPAEPVTIDVVMPNNAEPWETLDLYTWTGEAWEWVGSELHTELAEHEHIRAQVTDIPENLVVVQAGPITPTVSISLGSGDNPVAAAGVLDEINPTGLLLGTDGGLIGDPASLPQPAEESTYAVLPTLRNWAPGGTVNRGLLSDLLTIPEIQEAHIVNVVQLCTAKGFGGVDVDYRGVAPEDRDAYSSFISALSRALHAEGLRLTVVVESPTPAGSGWDTGGYDWVALGAAADAVKVPFPVDPAAYVEGGEAQRLLDWATAQLGRYKLRMLISSLSAERSSEGISYISLEQALAQFGEAVAVDNVSQVVEPNSQVAFGFSGRLLSITPQEAIGTYRLEYEADEEETRTVWLGTAASLAAKLHWAQRYHLGGVAVADMLAPGNAAGITEAVAAYRAASTPPAGQGIDVVWTVTSAEAMLDQQVSPLTEPGYTWMVLATTGTYTVNATIGGFDHGSVAISVGEPEEPMATEPASAAEITPASALAVAEGGEVDECLDARYVADVTIPDNTQLDNGEAFVKTWRVRNAGTCAWPEDTVMAFADGSQMGAPDSVEVGAVESGAEIEVSVDMEAPAEAGRYTGVWRMRVAEGFFGGNLSVVIQAGEVTSPPPVAPIGGGSFELGGHILGYGYASQMHYAGMNWVKVQVRYPEDASGLVAEAHASGFKILLGALGSPQDVTSAGFVNDYANWFANLAAAGADAIEVWNEPNIEREWQIGHIDPAAYTRLLCAAYSAIKGANPNTLVVSGALSPTWHNPPYHWGDDVFLQGMAAAGAASCMDYVGAHYNSGVVPPSQRSGSPQGDHYSWYFWPMVDLYYGSFGGARQVVFTEMGYLSPEGYCQLPDNFLWAANTTVAQQARWLAEAASQAAASGKVRLIIVWNVDFTRYDCGPGFGDPQAGYAIIRPGGSCPACDALHNVLGTR